MMSGSPGSRWTVLLPVKPLALGTARVAGMGVAAATPMSARRTMMPGDESRKPATDVVTAKAPVPQASIRFRPNLSPVLPATGRNPAKVRA